MRSNKNEYATRLALSVVEGVAYWAKAGLALFTLRYLKGA